MSTRQFSLAFSFIVASIIIVGLTQFQHHNDASDYQKKEIQKAAHDWSKKAVKQLIDTPKSLSAVRNCRTSDQRPLLSDTPPRSLVAPTDDQTFEARENPRLSLERARAGDAQSAIALFNMISSCYPLGRNNSTRHRMNAIVGPPPDCPAVPQQLLNDRLSILDESAKNGSPEAQLTYAMNALSIARYYRNQNTTESENHAKLILKQSETYGRSAAESGLIDAYLFMSRAYATGALGNSDPELAFAYALPLSKTNLASSAQELITQLSINLTTDQKQRALNVAFGCPVTEKELLTSPFG